MYVCMYEEEEEEEEEINFSGKTILGIKKTKFWHKASLKILLATENNKNT